jgi:hypothetical protein
MRHASHRQAIRPGAHVRPMLRALSCTSVNARRITDSSFAFTSASDQTKLCKSCTRAEVEQLLKDTGLEKDMQNQIMWPLWQNGDRGRQP